MANSEKNIPAIFFDCDGVLSEVVMDGGRDRSARCLEEFIIKPNLQPVLLKDILMYCHLLSKYNNLIKNTLKQYSLN